MSGGGGGGGRGEELAPRELLRGLGVGSEDVDADRAYGGSSAGWSRPVAGAALLGAMLAAGTVIRESQGISRAAGAAAGSVEIQGDSAVQTKKFGSDVMLGATAAASIAAGALAGDAVQWRVEDWGNGHWYAAARAATGISWADANARAQALGGNLASITSAAENQFVFDRLVSDPSLWSGQILEQGPWFGGFLDGSTWRWTTGEPWSFAAWCDGTTSPPERYTQFNHCQQVASAPQPIWNDHWGEAGGVSGNGLPIALVVEWSADCNADGIVDYGQILNGTLADTNANGIPDVCECATNPALPSCCIGDVVHDGVVNGADLGTLLAYWGPRTSASFSIASDLDGNGRIDGADLGALLANWGTCPVPQGPSWATILEMQPDPAVVTDASLREAIVATGLPRRVRDTGTQIDMLLVPPGNFQMGCTAASTNDACPALELAVHTVTLTHAFYLGRTELMQATWTSLTGSNPSAFRSFADSPNRPVESVSWNDATNFVAARGLRLPTEAEWEFACRAGSTSAFHNGSNQDADADAIAWHFGNSANGTHPVAMKSANALGLYDMAGNVWEWTQDWWDGSGHPYSDAAQTDPVGPTAGTYRSCRGGCWSMTTRYVRSSARGNATPSSTSSSVGFRVARNP